MKKFNFVLFCIVLGSCQSKSYQIVVRCDKPQLPEVFFQVFYDRYLVGSTETINEKNGVEFLTLQIPDSINIPDDSDFIIGYADLVRTPGIRIQPGSSRGLLKNKDSVTAVRLDQIIVENTPTDTAFIIGVFDLLKKMKSNSDSVSIKSGKKKKGIFY